MLRRTSSSVPGHRTLTFVLPAEWVGRASVVGNFNDWTPGALPLTAGDEGAVASVDLPADYIAVFRYLGDGGHWFDEPEADFVDAGGSVVLEAAGPQPLDRSLSPAEKAQKVSRKRRQREEEKAAEAVEKAHKKRKKLADKVAQAADKQRKAAKKVAKEREKAQRKAAKNEKKAK
ncbi:MAG: isoamylase early set domain-containing protein [Propionibacteriaceae bacterium]|nr:isoamylase early set domain-containing protein [Propionibacteriaceae bacterium]